MALPERLQAWALFPALLPRGGGPVYSSALTGSSVCADRGGSAIKHATLAAAHPGLGRRDALPSRFTELTPISETSHLPPFLQSNWQRSL